MGDITAGWGILPTLGSPHPNHFFRGGPSQTSWFQTIENRVLNWRRSQWDWSSDCIHRRGEETFE